MQTVVYSVFQVNILSAKRIEYGSGFYVGAYPAKRQKNFWDSYGRGRNVIHVVKILFCPAHHSFRHLFGFELPEELLLNKFFHGIGYCRKDVDAFFRVEKCQFNFCRWGSISAHFPVHSGIGCFHLGIQGYGKNKKQQP